jgi:F-type H+-transporting ATPase subunit alpha
VGGNAQIKAMKEVAGSLRLDLASFRELEAFAQLGTELDPASQKQLDRGGRMVELLKQGQYMPFDAIDQCLSIFSGSKGLLDDLPLNEVHNFEEALLEHFNGPKRDLRAKLVEKKSFKGMEDEFIATMKAFKAGWKPAGQSVAPSTKPTGKGAAATEPKGAPAAAKPATTAKSPAASH